MKNRINVYRILFVFFLLLAIIGAGLLVRGYLLRREATTDEYKHISYSFEPQGKYLSVCLFLTKSGHVEWKNIKVHKECDTIMANPSDLSTKNILADINYESA